MTLETTIRDMMREQMVMQKEIRLLREIVGKIMDADTRIHLGRAQTVQVAAGVMTPSAHSHYRVQPETGLSDEVNTITGTHAGQQIVLFPLTDTDITIKDGTGNITLTGGDAVLDANHKNITVIYSDALEQWFETARSV